MAGLLDGTAEVPGLVMDAELRWAFLQRLAVLGRSTDEQIDAELARDATDSGLREAQRARASLPDAAHKEAAWVLLTETEDLGPQGISAVTAGFGEPLHAELLAPYAEKYFEYLPILWSKRSGSVRLQLAEQLFPFPSSGPRLVELVGEYLADPEIDPALRRVVIEGVDFVNRIMRSRAL